jgi:lysophospholipid acyltransferase (LPLAT)-like uncharacterized protein
LAAKCQPAFPEPKSDLPNHAKDPFLKAALKIRVAKWYVGSLQVTLAQPLPEPGIIALWHQDLAMAMKAFAGKGIRVLLSASQDGEIAARCAESLGYQVSRGSSSRQGSAGLRSLIRAHRSAPGWIGMALDGPRGPRFRVKPGTLWLGHSLDLPIYPLGMAAKRWVSLRGSWDQARLPMPYFSPCSAYLGPSLLRPTAPELEAAMEAARQQAEAPFRMPDRMHWS